MEEEEVKRASATTPLGGSGPSPMNARILETDTSEEEDMDEFEESEAGF